MSDGKLGESHLVKNRDNMESQQQTILDGVFDQVMEICAGEGTQEQVIFDELEQDEWRYEHDQLLEKGGMKRILRCYDRRSGREVARAEMLDPEADASKFLREARITAHLQHPNIIPIHDIGLNPNKQPYFTMKLIEGRDLQQLLKGIETNHSLAKIWPLEARVEIFSRVCEAMAYAHHKGVIHLDIKPANVQVSDYGRVLVCDWGLARVQDSVCEEESLIKYSLDTQELNSLTADGYIKGTPGYMSPEQAGGAHTIKDQRSDIYSLGALLYSLLCLKNPFSGNSEDMVKATRLGKIIPLERQASDPISAGLKAICMKAMALGVEQRYQSVDDLQKDLLAWRHGFAPEAEEAGFFKQLRLLYKRNRQISLIITGSFFILLGSGVFFIDNLRRSEAQARQARAKVERTVKALENETHRRILLGKDAAPRYLEKAIAAQNNYDFKAATEFADLAVELDESLSEAWSTKALMHFVRQEFKESATAYSRYGNPKLAYMQQWADEFALRKGDKKELFANDIFELFKRMLAKNSFFYERMVHGYCYSEHSVNNRLKLYKLLLKHRNGNKEVKFSFDSGHLDLSGNPHLHKAYILQKFPASSLNLSGCDIFESVNLRGMPLKQLSLRNCSRLNELKSLIAMPLRELNISGTRIHHAKHILPLKNLLSLSLNKGQFSAEELAKLPKHIKVIQR